MSDILTTDEVREFREREGASSHRCRDGAKLFYNTTTQSVVIVPMSCGRWSCPSCAAHKVKTWKWKIANARPQRFITWTRNPATAHTPWEAYTQMKAGLPKAIAAIRKKFGPTEFCAIWELHQDGFPHLHIAQKGPFIPHAWLSYWLPSFGLGFINDISACSHPAKTAAYVAKYMTKTIALANTAFYIKRLVLHSRHFFPADEEAPTDQEIGTWRGLSTHRRVAFIIDTLRQNFGFEVLAESREDRIILTLFTPAPDEETFLKAIYKAIAESR